MVPVKALHYLPLIPRLKRLYASMRSAPHMRWHHEYRRPPGVLSHPSDGETFPSKQLSKGERSKDQLFKVILGEKLVIFILITLVMMCHCNDAIADISEKRNFEKSSRPLSRQGGPDATRAAAPRWGKLEPKRDRREKM
ncbi:hypothetical protein MTR67_002737 [Solanum verrucosum]|uniref:Uncharacterized protein n=1 Tax=Solanum verrucosum TaxID=315347 RepID=A0AAF0T680_SOLVR|nr:hypothetical protein MTR67_002737 [Solanum verrucosum]